MARSLKKGPFADESLLKKSRCYERSWTEAGYQNLVTSFYNFPFIRGTYNCSS